MGKMRGLSVAETAKSIVLNEEEYSERQISKKLKFSKIAIHQAIVKFRNFGSFRTCTGQEDTRLTPKEMTT